MTKTPYQRTVVILASAGRPQLLSRTISDLAAQTLPHDLIVSVPDDASLPTGGLPESVRVVYARGLAAQRNAGIAVAGDADHIFFFDDDAVVRPDYLERGVAFFEQHPDVVGITGRVLLDGAVGDEIPIAEAGRALEESSLEPPRRRWSPTAELYGCNFAYRPIAAEGELFDARLPLYSWLEDHDFARRLLRHGALAKVDDCVIVHLGAKSGGRTAHTRLGYSQMMNPLYLRKAGSFPTWLAVREIVPRCSKNLVLSLVGPEAGWRRERVRGNVIALGDAIRGRYTPERMLDF